MTTLNSLIRRVQGDGSGGVVVSLKPHDPFSQYNKNPLRTEPVYGPLPGAPKMVPVPGSPTLPNLNPVQKQPTELEMHRADYEAIRNAGFDSPGELLAAYRTLDEAYRRLSDEHDKQGQEVDHWCRRYRLLNHAVQRAMDQYGVVV